MAIWEASMRYGKDFFICDECWCSYSSEDFHADFHDRQGSEDREYEKANVLERIEEGDWICSGISSPYQKMGWEITPLYGVTPASVPDPH